MIVALDHAVVAVPDLEAATARTAALLGHDPAWRGVHPGAGSANALFALANTSLELLAPRGEGPVGRLVEAALRERGPGLLALAFATPDAAAEAAALRAAGLAVGEVREGRGVADDGAAERRWRSAWIAPGSSRGLGLFAIERLPPLPAPPPRADAAAVHALDHVVIASADLEASRALFGGALGLRLALERRFDARGLHMLFFRVGGATVEVVGRLDAAPDASAPDGFGGLAWRVADVDAARARLAAAGFDVSEVRAGFAPGTRVCTVRGDTCGVPTLLIQPAARAPRVSAGPAEG